MRCATSADFGTAGPLATSGAEGLSATAPWTLRESWPFLRLVGRRSGAASHEVAQLAEGVWSGPELTLDRVERSAHETPPIQAVDRGLTRERLGCADRSSAQRQPSAWVP